jgi:tetratricopeptide (TPR) repeat protein
LFDVSGFGNLVKSYRGRKRLTQATLALDVFGDENRKGDISRIENGKAGTPQEATLQKLKAKLDIPQDAIDALRSEAVVNDAYVDALRARVINLADSLHLTHELVTQVARRNAIASHDNFDAALAGIEEALRVTAADRAKPLSNLGAVVDQVFAQVNALNDSGNLEGGTRALKAAMAAQKGKLAEAAQGYKALLAKGVAQAVLDRSVPDAVNIENEILLLDEPDNTLRFWARQKRLTNWYQKGRSRGVLFDLEVSTSLAQENIKAARSEQQVGAAWDDFGTILIIIGDLKGSDDHYSRAMKAYEKALSVTDKVQNLSLWLISFNNLAISIRKLGALRGDQSLLEKAASCFDQVLKNWTRGSDPRNWARARNNLGIALTGIGALAGSAFHLQLAVEAFQDALSVWTIVVEPIDWPAANRNLGHALTSLGSMEKNVSFLEKALIAFGVVLPVHIARQETFLQATVLIAQASCELSIAENSLGPKRKDNLSTALIHVQAGIELFDPSQLTVHFDNALRLRDAIQAALAGGDGRIAHPSV